MDIGVVRIQSWLTRTPKLRGRRGGSTLITQATDHDAIREVLSGFGETVEVHSEGGRIDGVVPLKLHDEAQAAAAEKAVVRHIRSRMPGVSLSVKRYSGDTYAVARSVGARQEHEWPAPAVDWPAGLPCQWCRTLPADPAPGARDEDGLRRCAECLARDAAAGRADGRDVPFAESELLHRLGIAEAKVPDEFKPMAELDRKGNRPDADGQTHLALVYADGNAIGKFITSALRHAPRKKRRSPDFAAAIDGSTWQALVTAVEQIRQEDQELLPVVPHFVGGDDVLVSVPACRAWRFTRALLGAFDEAIKEASGLHTDLPSLSAGVVFHHYTVPLYEVNELAKTALRRAKVHTSGEAASLAWHDTTHDGHDPVARSALTLADLEQKWDALHRLAKLPRSAHARLEAVTRAYGSRSSELLTHAIRVGSDQVIRQFQGSFDLADALGMARWWWHDDQA